MKKFSKVIPYLLLPLAAFIISNWFVTVMLIQGESMAPAYHSYQFVLVNRMARQPERGTVVAFRCQEPKGVLVKRVAGVPGDVIESIDGFLAVNGEIYGDCRWEPDPAQSGEIHLAADEYFLVGDHFSVSTDSRDPDIGPVWEGDILGTLIPNRPMLTDSIGVPTVTGLEISSVQNRINGWISQSKGESARFFNAGFLRECSSYCHSFNKEEMMEISS